jgi:CDP-diacylglycerol--glycerol-3-phosphate 3-phosphatidyltransferase
MQEGLMGAIARKIPAALIAFRALMILVVPVLGWYGHGYFLAFVILAATLSDIFDGIIARRLGVSTTNLRKADSTVDLFFWLASMTALYFLRPDDVMRNLIIVFYAVAAEIIEQLISLLRFHRMTATHARSAKFMGLCLLVGMMVLACYGNSAFAFWIIGIGVTVSIFDGCAIVVLLPAWEADVPSAWEAWRMRQGLPIRRHWLG